jgi:hypothetical protein
MPKLCKPSKTAIWQRIEAVKRHARIHQYLFELPLNPSVFGLDKTTKEGVLDLFDILVEIKSRTPPDVMLKKDKNGLYIYADNYDLFR